MRRKKGSEPRAKVMLGINRSDANTLYRAAFDLVNEGKIKRPSLNGIAHYILANAIRRLEKRHFKDGQLTLLY